MTLPSINTTTTLPGNGSAVLFDFSFKVWEPTDLEVWVTDRDNIVTKLPSNWSVLLNSNQDAHPGGTVKYPLSGDPLSENEEITIKRGMPFTQLAKFFRGRGFDPVVIGTVLNRIKAELQELRETIQRSIRIPVSKGSVNTRLPSPVAGSYLAWNAVTDAIINAVGQVDAALVNMFTRTLLDDATAKEALTTLELNAFAKALLDDETDADALTTVGFKSVSDRLAWLRGVVLNQVGDGWVERSAPSAYWRDIAWSPELGLFAVVSVGTGDSVMTSPDGITWTRQSTPTDFFYGIAWSPSLDLFVATGPNRIMTSSDGVAWTLRTSPTGDWSSVTWSPDLGLFAAVSSDSSGNRVMTSSNGIDWTLRSTPADAGTSSWYDIAWSPELELFATVGDGDTGEQKIMTSGDGITWTFRSSPADDCGYCSLFGVTWSPELGIFVVVGGGDPGDPEIMTSSDGTNWTAYTTTVEFYWYDVAWSPELGMLAIGGAYYFITSFDGINWTLHDGTIDVSGIAWSPELGMFAAVATGSTVVTAGVSWTSKD